MTAGGSIVTDAPAFVIPCSLVRPAALLSTRRIPAAVPVYGRRRVLLNRGWSLGEEEDHHNGGRKARSSGQNRDAGPKPLSGGSAHQPDTRRTGCGCQQGDPQPLPQPRKLIEPSHINYPPLSAQPVSILQGHGHPDGRGRGQSSGSVRPDWEPGWAAASFFHTAPVPPWAFCPGTYKCR